MKSLLRFSFLLCFMLVAGIAIGYLFWYKPAFSNVKNPSRISEVEPLEKVESGAAFRKKLLINVNSIKAYCDKKNYNATRCFMIDMSMPSGKKRFFIYNLKTDSVEYSGLVTHGSGSVTSTGKLNFSNVPGSGCTSLGKYKIGSSYQGRFGLAYKLHGLDKTNNKAFERFVVLHAHACVPEAEIYPFEICPSLGCPTVSPEFLQKLKVYLDKASEPILLSIYQ